MTERLLLNVRRDPVDSSSGSSRLNISSVIEWGREDEACKRAAMSALAGSMSQLVIKSPRTAFNWAHVSSFLLFV